MKNEKSLKIVFIRHGMTEGNKEKRYVGRTDESLCEEGIHEVLCKADAGIYPGVSDLMKEHVLLVSSPMKRCIETAELIFPGISPEIYDEFAECDFGDFEYRNYMELSDNVNYKAWIESGGKSGFPGGESLKASQERFAAGFVRAAESASSEGKTMLISVVHGGTVMSVMSQFEEPKRDYYFWHIANGDCLTGIYNPEKRIITEVKKITGK